MIDENRKYLPGRVTRGTARNYAQAMKRGWDRTCVRWPRFEARLVIAKPTELPGTPNWLRLARTSHRGCPYAAIQRLAKSAQIGRTSIVATFAMGCLDAASMACSSVGHSISSYAHIFSLDLANGPAVSCILPSRTRTVMASLGGLNGFPYLRTPRLSISSIQATISLTKDCVGTKDSSWQMISRNCIWLFRFLCRDRRAVTKNGGQAQAATNDCPCPRERSPAPIK